MALITKTLRLLGGFRTRLYAWYGRKTVLGTLIFIILLIIGGILMRAAAPEMPTTEEREHPAVRIATVRDLSKNGALELIGTVKAVDEVHLESEASGRITSVSVTLGQAVSAGSVIAQIENASERAALLQAEGAYESAVASAASSDVGVAEAESAALNAYRTAYATVNDIVLNTIDSLFADPDGHFPGLRITGFSSTSYLNEERIAYQTLLPEWQQQVTALSQSDNLSVALTESRERVVRTKEIVETFLSILPRQDANGRYTQSELNTFQNNFVTAQQSLNSTITSLDSALESLARSRVTGTGNAVSSADAQIKQALGSLRSAQANYAKTIIRTPISGTVNSLSVRSGDYVGMNTPVAVVANNNALLITTYINQSDRTRITIGDTVRIADRATGTVARIAPAVDPVTKKIEVEVETTAANLENGDTVRLKVASQTQVPEPDPSEPEEIIVPITALKVGTDRTVVFTVSTDNTLIAHEIEEGPLVGDGIIVESGVTVDMEIVLDARGLSEGGVVSVIRE